MTKVRNPKQGADMFRALGIRILNLFRISDFRFRISVLTLGLAICGGPVQAAPPQVYKAARIWTGDGPPVANGVLVVRDGKVVAVGPRDKIAVPEEAEVHDLGPAVLIPGLVIAETTLGERGRDDD